MEKKNEEKAEQMERVARRTYCRSGDIHDRTGARDAAAKLCFSIIKQSLPMHENKVRKKVVTDVLYVVSHAKTFGPRLRRHIWKTIESKVRLTPGQLKQFAEWVTEDALSLDFYSHDDSDEEGSRTDCDCTTGSIHEHTILWRLLSSFFGMSVEVCLLTYVSFAIVSILYCAVYERRLGLGNVYMWLL